MDRKQMISVFLLVVLTIHSVAAAKWPTFPGPEGIRSSTCQADLNCKSNNIVTRLGTCKAFCLGRKRFWQKCGKDGELSKSKICNPYLAQAVEKVGKGLMKVSDKAVHVIIGLATTAILAGK
ncbi:cerebratulus toxin A-III-like [Lineus longissimus]|uniref:cerebratulus toxin A-III-like n=1 Tax=Lineus longissimus TaxID=88925 RepID=UPI002B4EDB8B